MPNFLKLLSTYTTLTPEAIIVIALLFGILSSLISMLYVVIRAYISFKVKQEHCEGRFDRQRDDIVRLNDGFKEVKAESGETRKTVQKIEICTTKMQQTVEDIKTGYEEFIKDKWGKNAKKETT